MYFFFQNKKYIILWSRISNLYYILLLRAPGGQFLRRWSDVSQMLTSGLSLFVVVVFLFFKISWRRRKNKTKKKRSRRWKTKAARKRTTSRARPGSCWWRTAAAGWREKRRGGGGGGGASVTAVFNINNFCRAASCSDARTLALKAGTVDSSVQQNPARRGRRGRRGRRSTLRGGKKYGFGGGRLLTCARHMLLC